jgi:hypothetical protein
MKVYFCRDIDGEVTTWRYKQAKPVWHSAEGIWDNTYKNAANNIVTEGTENTFKKFGKGYHGVRKGQMKLLDLKPKIRGVCKGL